MYYNQAIIFGEASVDLLNVKDIDIYGTNCVADVSTDDGDCVRFVSAKEKYFDVKVDNGTLTVTQKSRNLLLRLISGRIEFKLILPRGFNGRLRYRNNNGGLYIKNAELADIELSTKNGKFDISSVTANAFSLKMKNGSIAFKSLTVRDACAVKCKNGDVKVEAVTAAALNISCNNAGLFAADIKCKKIDCVTSNGVISASALDADELRLETSNGKINAMVIGARDDYRLVAETYNGSITVDGVPSKSVSDASSHASKKLTAKTSNGDIDVRFM